MVLVDTPVWSLSLRRRAIDLSPADRRVTQNLYGLVRQKRVKLLGSTRQEVLSGIREESQFLRIYAIICEASETLNWMSMTTKRRRKQVTGVAAAGFLVRTLTS